MKRHIQTLGAAVVLACLLTPIAASAQDFVTLPAGTRLSLVQQTTVSSESSNVGDLVVAKTRLHVRDRRGQILIPAGTEVRGRVTSADPGGKMKGRAVLGITFDRLVLRGEEIPMTTTRIVVRAKSQAKRDAAGVAAGTIGGAVVGGIVGGKKGARIGAVTGAGAGTAAAVSTRGPQVTFAAGSRRLVSLTRSLRVPREVRVPSMRDER